MSKRSGRAPSRAFTLLELIVVIVVLGVLAALALPTYAAVVERTRDEQLAATIASTLREATALARLRDSNSFTQSDLATAVGDIAAAAPGTSASTNWTLRRSPLESAAVAGEMHVSIESPPTSAGLAARSVTGSCVYGTVSIGGSVETFIDRSPDADTCNGDTALEGEGGSGVTTPTVLRASVAADGTQGNGGSSGSNIAHRPHAWVSNDGSETVFHSNATNLVAGDTNGVRDVFYRDMATSTVTRLSAPTAGGQANGTSGWPSASADGDVVAFESAATNLVAGDTNATVDIFALDRSSNTLERISVATDGTQANGQSSFPNVSLDGTLVVFTSAASNLVPGDTNGQTDVFLRDLSADTTTLISSDASGTIASGGLSQDGYLSGNGEYVAFRSAATNLVAGDTNAASDVFVKTIATGAISRVSVSDAEAQSNGSSTAPSMSNDGRLVAFYSLASNLVAGDTNATGDVFVRDTLTGTTTRMSVATDGTQGNGESAQALISPGGTELVFRSEATNLVAGDTNGVADLFVRDLETSTTTRITVSSAGVEADGPSASALFSPNGTKIGFGSAATNLVEGDTNGVDDMFLTRL